MSERGKAGLASFLLFCISLSLTSYSAQNRSNSSFANQVIAEAIRPFSSFTYTLYDFVTSGWDGYLNLVGVKEENEKIQARLHVLESQNARLEEIEKENERLKNLLKVAPSLPTSSVAARVIGYDPSGWVQAITINRGARDGIKEKFPVIDGAGVVGQVITVSHSTARVLLVIDRASGIDALIQDNRARGIIEGSGSPPVDFRFVVDSDEVKIGEKVITSGLDGVFPKGLIIGLVTQAGVSSGGMFKVIKVQPSVNFSKLEDVLILLNPTEGGQS